MDGTPADGESDAELMQRYRAGDERAFNALYLRHEGALFRFVCRQLHDQPSARDLVQEVWFAVARAARHYHERDRFRPWLYTLARHRIIDHARGRRPRLALVPRIEEAAPAASPTPEAQLDAAQAHAQLLAVVAQLPFEQREAFLLLAEAELSIEDIAAVTAVNSETVKSRLRYARQKLRQLLPERP